MFNILVPYVDGILLASSDKNLLYETKGFLSSNFDMKDLGDASYVLHKCSTTHVPFMKGDKLGTF
jgi:hypothetical protein